MTMATFESYSNTFVSKKARCFVRLFTIKIF
jgi:hypothetical protein